MTGAGPSGGARAVPHAPSLWYGDVPDGSTLQLVHRAHLLATNPAVTHRRCGSVSVKGRAAGEPDALWMGGAGRDLLALAPDGVAGIDLAHLLPLQRDGGRPEGRLAPRPAAEALLHAVVPAAHVDRTSPDAIAMLCCAANGEQLAETCFGEEAVWLPYAPPGFVLAHAVRRATAKPGVRCVLVAHQGLVTWGETSEVCYARTLAATNRAADFVSAQAYGPRFGGQALTPLGGERRDALLAELLPALRRALGGETAAAQVLQVDTSPRVRELVCSRDGAVLAQAGAASAAHVAHVGHLPLWIDFDPWRDDVGALTERVVRGVARHRAQVDAPANGAGPRVVLIAGVGMIAVGATAAHAKLVRDVYHRTIEAIAGASSIDVFAPLPVVADPPL